MTMISMCQFIKQKKDICRFFFVSIFSRLDNFINITEDKRKLKLHNLDVLRSVLLSKFGRIFYGCSSLMSWKMPDDICVDIVVVWMLNYGDNFMFILFVVKLYMYVNHVDPCNNRQTIKHTHTHSQRQATDFEQSSKCKIVIFYEEEKNNCNFLWFPMWCDTKSIL